MRAAHEISHLASCTWFGSETVAEACIPQAGIWTASLLADIGGQRDLLGLLEAFVGSSGQ